MQDTGLQSLDCQTANGLGLPGLFGTLNDRALIGSTRVCVRAVQSIFAQIRRDGFGVETVSPVETTRRISQKTLTRLRQRVTMQFPPRPDVGVPP